MHKIVIKLRLFSYPPVKKHVLGAQKNHHIKLVRFSTHNIFFGSEIKKNTLFYLEAYKINLRAVAPIRFRRTCTSPKFSYLHSRSVQDMDHLEQRPEPCKAKLILKSCTHHILDSKRNA